MNSRRLLITLSLFLFAMLASIPAVALEDSYWEYGTLSGQTRLYYFTQRNYDNNNDNNHRIRESFAVGGFLKYETPWLNDAVQAGIAGYGSAPVSGGLNRKTQGGTQLLSSRNQSLAVLGEAYLKGKYAKTVASVFRQRIDNPMVNSSDSRMIPNLFEAYSVTSEDVDDLRLQLAWVDKIKLRDSEVFRSMSEVSSNGALADSRRGMAMAGADWSPDSLKTRAWYYQIPDYLRMVFVQAGDTYPIDEELSLHWLVQGLDQRSTGAADGGSFNAAEIGVLGGVTWLGVKYDVGVSVVDNSANIVNKWGSYPFFNYVMVNENNRAGEKTLYLAAAYDFSRIGWKGFKSSIHSSFGSTPDSGRNASPNQREYDLKLNYDFDGDLKGLSLLNFWSYQTAKGVGTNQDSYQVRLRLQYDFTLFD